MKNFQLKEIGNLTSLEQYSFAPEGSGINIPGKLFLGELLNLTAMEVSLNKTPAGTGMNFVHSHDRHEEVYIFISGSGEMQIDNQLIKIKQGSVLSLKPAAKRSWWNTGDSDLIYIIIQAPESGMSGGPIDDGKIHDDKIPWL